MIGFSEIHENSPEAREDYECEQSDRIRELTNEVNALKDERDSLKAELTELRSEREALGQVKSAATYLLENYSSGHPSAGEVDALAEDLTQLLTEKYNISKGII